MHLFCSCCVSVCFFYPCFFRYFSFFSLIKDNSNNNCFFEYFFYFPPTFSLFAVFFSLSFLLYCMVYYKKLFTSCFEPSQLALPAFFSLFLFEIYHWIINFKFYPPLPTNLSHSLQLSSILLTLTLILNLPSRFCCCCCCPNTFIIVFAFLLCFCFSL